MGSTYINIDQFMAYEVKPILSSFPSFFSSIILLRFASPWSVLAPQLAYSQVLFLHLGQTGALISWSFGIFYSWRIVNLPPPQTYQPPRNNGLI